MIHLDFKTAQRINKRNRLKKGRVTYILEYENEPYLFLKRALPVKHKSNRMIVNKENLLIEH